MLSAVAAMTPGTLATPAAMVCVTLNVFASMRASEELPQTGAQKLSKAEAMPPQALARPAIGSAFLLVFGSILSITSFPGAKAAPEKKSHSGLAEASNSASALRLANGIWTPGVVIPSLGTVACVFAFADLGGLSAAARERRTVTLIRIRIVVRTSVQQLISSVARRGAREGRQRHGSVGQLFGVRLTVIADRAARRQGQYASWHTRDAGINRESATIMISP